MPTKTKAESASDTTTEAEVAPATKPKAKAATPAKAKAAAAGTTSPAAAAAPHEAYCVKCREKRQMIDAVEVKMKNGHPALQSKCPVCGTTLNRILPNTPHAH